MSFSSTPSRGTCPLPVMSSFGSFGLIENARAFLINPNDLSRFKIIHLDYSGGPNVPI